MPADHKKSPNYAAQRIEGKWVGGRRGKISVPSAPYDTVPAGNNNQEVTFDEFRQTVSSGFVPLSSRIFISGWTSTFPVELRTDPRKLSSESGRSNTGPKANEKFRYKQNNRELDAIDFLADVARLPFRFNERDSPTKVAKISGTRIVGRNKSLNEDEALEAIKRIRNAKGRDKDKDVLYSLSA